MEQQMKKFSTGKMGPLEITWEALTCLNSKNYKINGQWWRQNICSKTDFNTLYIHDIVTMVKSCMYNDVGSNILHQSWDDI